MKKGMIFDIYRDGEPTVRVVAMDDKNAISLVDGTLICDIDFENEVDSVIIDNILEYGSYTDRNG